jgi:alkylation response protein AidB-like acyl-CoA dehydrogenase
MKTPGITVQPIVQLTGESKFCQTFFDNVRVPRANMLGEENRGWYVAATTLDFERSGVAAVTGVGRNLARLVEHLKGLRGGSSSPLDRPPVRYGIADLAVAVEVGRLLAYRVAWMQSAKLVPNQEASISKVYGTELEQKFGNFAVKALGMFGQLNSDSPRAVLGGMARNTYLSSLGVTIYAGTSEIQRNIIAQRGLGLPR